MTPPAIRIRRLTQADEPLLWEAVYHAIYVPQGQSPPPKTIIDDPNVARYVNDWGRSGDMGFAAETTVGRPLGACWLRCWNARDRGYGYVDDQTAELSLAVWPGHRAQGIGTRLIRAALEEAEQQYPAVSLSVTSINPAVRLYDRMGFERLGEQGGTLLMLRKN
ncbi:MAG: GNAT family N-acetyltransferase [Planctomycetota bacterium]|nr:MAG: GNAT family N-acetyltransferase [Planctomycetota bacterium]